MNLICANASRQDCDPLKPIICKTTGVKCVCCSCSQPIVGFKMNLWVKDCPGFKEK